MQKYTGVYDIYLRICKLLYCVTPHLSFDLADALVANALRMARFQVSSFNRRNPTDFRSSSFSGCVKRLEISLHFLEGFCHGLFLDMAEAANCVRHSDQPLSQVQIVGRHLTRNVSDKI